LGGSVQYNASVQEINQLIDRGLYKESFIILSKIRNETIFDNPQLAELAYVLSLKLPVNTFRYDIQKEKLTYREKGIYLARRYKLEEANHFLRAGILSTSTDDSLVKLFEIYAHFNRNRVYKRNPSTANMYISRQVNTKLDHNDAILVLDLMKKKEKLLNY
jgi:hypothetical protein